MTKNDQATINRIALVLDILTPEFNRLQGVEWVKFEWEKKGNRRSLTWKPE